MKFTSIIDVKIHTKAHTFFATNLIYSFARGFCLTYIVFFVVFERESLEKWELIILDALWNFIYSKRSMGRENFRFFRKKIIIRDDTSFTHLRT